MDIFVGLRSENAQKILQTLSDFGFSDLGLTENDFLEPDMVVEIGREPLKIQVLTGIDGVCLLYTSDAADEGLGVDLGGRRII